MTAVTLSLFFGVAAFAAGAVIRDSITAGLRRARQIRPELANPVGFVAAKACLPRLSAA